MRRYEEMQEQTCPFTVSSGGTGVSSYCDAASASPQLSLSVTLSLFLPLSLSFSTPPFSPLLLFLTHTLSHRGMPESVEVLGRVVGVPGLLRPEPNRSVISSLRGWSAAFWRHIGGGFLIACGHLRTLVKTEMPLLYEDMGMMIMKAIWWGIYGV